MSEKTILLIDDDSDMLQAVEGHCLELGLIVTKTRNLLTATQAIEKRVPDVVCVDVNMPTGNGLRFCEALLADRKTAHVPIIVLTGQGNAEAEQSCRRMGLHYVEKNREVWTTLDSVLRNLLASEPPRTAAARIKPQPLPDRLIPPLPADADDAGPAKLPLPPDDGLKMATKQVVVADDDPDLVWFLSQRFSSLGCSVIGANSALEAINAIHRIVPDLVVLDVNMPSGNGLSVCEMMSTDPELCKIPVIVLTGLSDENTIRRCHDMLVFYVQKGSTIWNRIEPLVRELLHLPEAAPAWKEPPTAAELASMRDAASGPSAAKSPAIDARDALMDAVFAMLGSTGDESRSGIDDAKTGGDERLAAADEPPWVLCIDDDTDFSDALKVRFEQHGVAVVRAYSGMEGYRLAFTSPASAIVLDYNLPNGQGDYVLDRLKNNRVTQDLPVFVVTGVKDKMLQRRMLAMGAAGFLHKPVDFEALRQHLAAHIDILSAPATASSAG